MNLVMVPFHDWKKCEREGFRTRDAHLMEEFGRHPLVDRLLVINRPTSIAEILALRRNWHVVEAEQSLLEGPDYRISQVAPKTYTLDFRVWELVKPLVLRRHWTPYVFAKRKFAEVVRRGLAYLEINESDYALLLSAPLFVPLAKQLRPSRFALDAQDNLLKHAQYRDIPELESYYWYCQDKADFISANSLETSTWLAERRPDVLHISNGYDDRKFGPDQTYPTPADLLPVPRPIVGFAGKMQEMIDVTLLEQVMAELPWVSFVFIGQILDGRWVKSLWQLPNAHYLGDKPYEILPHYLSAFDVCMIPYSIERQHGGDPIKFYEYLAMGKPVVTTRIGNVSAFEHYSQVRIAETVDEFIEGLTTYIALMGQEGQGLRIKPLPEDFTWRCKADTIIRAILG